MNTLRLFALFAALILLPPGNSESANPRSTPIDRQSLVNRHLPRLTRADTLSPFTVGNGEFAYTVDITGLQTFAEVYENGIPLGTQAQWGWHSVRNPNNSTLDQTFEFYDTYHRQVSYAAKQHSDAGQWLRANPHRLHLGRIGLRILQSNGSEAEIGDITNIQQVADMWQGIIKSAFVVEGQAFRVETACHPAQDEVAFRIQSGMLATGSVSIRLDLPYGSLSWGKTTADWDSPEAHTSEIVSHGNSSVTIAHTLDQDRYFIRLNWSGSARFEKTKNHSFLLHILETNTFEFACHFLQDEIAGPTTSPAETFEASESHWQNFWQTGGAIDLSKSSDPRAHELERRIVLSRYLTAVQCAGSSPPQETGLTFNSWHGKFHLEMHWWHAVHFALWEKPELLERSMPWYSTILPMARQKAERQGYAGVRWPKMVAHDGRESPSTIGVFLIWQQPNPIYYAELLYRCYRDSATLQKYRDIVFESAEFMASYAHWDETNSRYVLGPPLIPAQEIHKPEMTRNPAFELSYWAFGLKTAQLWRERLGLPRVEKWDHVIANLSRLPMNDGLYQNAETALNTFTDASQRRDHPTVLGAYGMLPNDKVDVETMRRTLRAVLQSWDWASTWGWDFPMVAMTAARVGEPELAIEALMMDVHKNTYLNNGHNYQRETLPIYLPGNGGLLTAVAMMAAGWDGGPEIKAPGFPKNDKWVVKVEGLKRMP